MSRYNVFISACRGIAADAENTVMLRDTLDRAGLPSVACEGVYGGVKEASFKVLCDDESEVLVCFFQGKFYNQDCILVVDTVGRCYQFINCQDAFRDQFNGEWTNGGMYPVLNADGDHTKIGGLPYQLMNRL